MRTTIPVPNQNGRGPLNRISLISISLFFVSFAFAQTRFQSATDVSPKIQQVSPDDIWNEVKVDLNWLSSYLNVKSCSQSQRMYLGCVLAVQTFAGVLEKNLDVVPVSLLNGKVPFIKTDRLALVETVAPKISTMKDAYGFFEKKRKELSQLFFAASLQFVSSPNSDFEKLVWEINQRASKGVKSVDYVQAVSKLFEVAIDPHTSLQPRKSFEQSAQQSGSSFVGIGIEMHQLDQGILVQRVIKGGGAALAGILPGDLILAVDGKAINKDDTDDAVKMIRGLSGTKVVLTVQREGKTSDVEVTRAQVVNPVVDSTEIAFQNKKITQIRLTNFMYEKACEEIDKIIVQSERNNVDGYILDLRNNPGGNIKIAACLMGFFIGADKVVAYFEGKTQFGSKMDPLMSVAKTVTNKPLVLLINAGSASASEIIAGAVRDHSRGLIVGQTTFGKGSHQGCGALNNQSSLVICLTQGLFFSPSGVSNQNVGVEPHVSVFVNKVALEVETFALRETQLYLFPLGTKSMPSLPVGNWNRFKVPTNCMNNLNLGSVYEQANAKQNYFRDFQLLNAMAGVSCAGLN